MKILHWIIATTFMLLIGCGGSSENGSGTDTQNDSSMSIAELGELLFFDKNLSLTRNQSCASCHDPENAFIDPRDNGVNGAVSLGDDGVSLGDRNAPTAAYAQLIPAFDLNGGDPTGGQFHDGRASTLADQAAGPPTNAIEMGMPNNASTVDRILENSDYVVTFQDLFGMDIFDDVDLAYSAMAESIAAFEMTDTFAPFDSKYDRSRSGYGGDDPYTMTAEESLGETLFFSAQFTNCHTCHQLKTLPGRAEELFSNHKYFNIGIPVNETVRAANGLGTTHIDHGLLENPAISNNAHEGKFKVPTLRNIGVTGPYMHNGIFSNLQTVVLFYDKFNNLSRTLNPETGLAWSDPETPHTVATTELEEGPALDDDEVDAIVAFLHTLTDKRYE
ncbi:MAG: c-type cytochrome [Pseudomonadales bacterium]|nr:c-type cytochrome [Pseudomonadales bacterium]